MATAIREFQANLEQINTIGSGSEGERLIAAAIVTLAHSLDNAAIQIDGLSELVLALDNMAAQPLVIDGMDQLLELLGKSRDD